MRSVLAHTVVEDEKNCCATAEDLLGRVRGVIELLERGGQRVNSERRPCRVCGSGHYTVNVGEDLQILARVDRGRVDTMNQAEMLYKNSGTRLTVRIRVCDKCGHVQMFQFADGNTPEA